MRSVEEILSGLDSLFEEQKMEEVEPYLQNALQEAMNAKEDSIVITIVNELIGFYRDLSLYEKAIYYYQKTIDKFLNAYNRIYEICKNEYKDDFETDKDAAFYIQTCTYPHVLFAMRKNQVNVMNNLIWKYVKNETKFEEND